MSLSLYDINHTYKSPTSMADDRQVLSITEWVIDNGQQILLRGVSGSGKTTLLNIIAGLMRPTKGTVKVDDVALYTLSEAHRDRFRAQTIGYVFQTHYLLNTLTAQENVVMPMAFAQSTPRTTWQHRAQTLLSELGLSDHLHYRPAQLSTGQRMRVAVARALANRPQIILADEPTAALDEASSHAVMDLLQTTCQQENAILIVASHDPMLVQRFGIIADLKAGDLTLHAAEAVLEA